ncbi:MAG: hypothetical protein FWE21_03680 [Defluviitaleaceae bacterium]|nr:hypothetical protein [Defluviitaleaceae bacterium]
MQTIIFASTTIFSFLVVVVVLILHRVREKALTKEVFDEGGFTMLQTRRSADANLAMVVLAVFYVIAMVVFEMEGLDFTPVIIFNTIIVIAATAQSIYRISWRCVVDGDEIIYRQMVVIPLHSVTKVHVMRFRRLALFVGDERVITIPLKQIDHISHGLLVGLLKSKNIDGAERLKEPTAKNAHSPSLSALFLTIQSLLFLLVAVDFVDGVLGMQPRILLRIAYTPKEVLEAYITWHRNVLEDLPFIVGSVFVINIIAAVLSKLSSKRAHLPFWAAVVSCASAAAMFAAIVWVYDAPGFMRQGEYDLAAIETRQLQRVEVFVSLDDFDNSTPIHLVGVGNAPARLYSLQVEDGHLLLSAHHHPHDIREIISPERFRYPEMEADVRRLTLYYTPIHRIVVEMYIQYQEYEQEHE